MILGTLSLFQKRGIFYKELQLHTGDQYSKLIEQELQGTAKQHFNRLPEKHRLIPLQESGNTDYPEKFTVIVNVRV